MPFGNVIGDRHGCPPHLVGQGILFLSRKLLDETVSPLSEFASDLIQFEIIQFETSVFHDRISSHYSPLTTHHSPLTTHHSLLTTHFHHPVSRPVYAKSIASAVARAVTSMTLVAVSCRR